jgi:hypothetical protein
MKTNSKILERKLSKTELETREKIIKDLMKNKSSLVKRYGKDAEKVMYGRSTNIAKKIMNTENKHKIKELVKRTLMKEQDIEVGADKYDEEQTLSQASNLLDEFETLLQTHDWHYEKSDDPRVFTKGDREEKNIKNKMKQLISLGHGEDAISLFNKYNPYNKQNESFPDLTGDGKVTKADILKGRGVELKEGDDFEGTGLIVVGRTQIDNNEISDMLDETDYHGVWNTREGYWFFPEDEETIDSLEMELSREFDNRGINARFEGQFNESMNEDLDIGHTDNEPHMIKGDLYRIGKYAMELYQVVSQFEYGHGKVDFPHWWQSKIIRAKEMLVAAKHYLDFETKEPEIDAMVGVTNVEPEHEIEEAKNSSKTKTENMLEDIISDMMKYKSKEEILDYLRTILTK